MVFFPFMKSHVGVEYRSTDFWGIFGGMKKEVYYICMFDPFRSDF